MKFCFLGCDFMEWKEQYPKSKKPNIVDVDNYLADGSVKLYREFLDSLSKKLHLSYVKPVYLMSSGWGFEVGRSGLIMINNITFKDHRFYVDNIEVSNKEVLNKILLWAEDLFNKDFSHKFNEFSAMRFEKQKERDARRKQREKEYIVFMKDRIDQSIFNMFKWSPRISRSKLQRLYESDAKGVLDSELLEEVGCTIYARCLQSKEERLLMDSGKMKCHYCNNILKANSGLITCNCGFQYIFKDYRRSFRANNMPTGGAAHIFNEFIDKWEQMKTDSDKMRLIDWLIHEFHINLLSGTKGRFVGVNLIQGTKSQIKDLILNLAYGDGGKALEINMKYFENHT
jgi:hypothetical protein